MESSKNSKCKLPFDYEVSGKGPPLIFLHGWPFHKATYNRLIPFLEPYFTCYNLNSLGMSNEGLGWQGHGMDFADHMQRVLAFADAQGLDDFSLLGHDTGATIARLVAAKAPSRVTRLIMMNTEMPNHRPPFIPFYQKLLQVPGSWRVMRMLLKSKTFRHSRMGFGNVFYDPAKIDADFLKNSPVYFSATPQRFKGLVAYLEGLDFDVVDGLDKVHAQITAPMLFIWGQNDITFETRLARDMVQRMSADVTFVEMPNCCFVPQEEKPAETARIILSHFEFTAEAP